MGIPIDPDDPVNGGCDVCIAYLPSSIRVRYRWFGQDDYDGIVFQDPGFSSVYSGFLDGTVTPPISFDMNFCNVGSPDLWARALGRGVFLVTDNHCDLPVSGKNQFGDRFFFSIP